MIKSTTQPDIVLIKNDDDEIPLLDFIPQAKQLAINVLKLINQIENNLSIQQTKSLLTDACDGAIRVHNILKRQLSLNSSNDSLKNRYKSAPRRRNSVNIIYKDTGTRSETPSKTTEKKVKRLSLPKSSTIIEHSNIKVSNKSDMRNDHSPNKKSDFVRRSSKERRSNAAMSRTKSYESPLKGFKDKVDQAVNNIMIMLENNIGINMNQQSKKQVKAHIQCEIESITSGSKKKNSDICIFCKPLISDNHITSFSYSMLTFVKILYNTIDYRDPFKDKKVITKLKDYPTQLKKQTKGIFNTMKTLANVFLKDGVAKTIGVSQAHVRILKALKEEYSGTVIPIDKKMKKGPLLYITIKKLLDKLVSLSDRIFRMTCSTVSTLYTSNPKKISSHVNTLASFSSLLELIRMALDTSVTLDFLQITSKTLSSARPNCPDDESIWKENVDKSEDLDNIRPGTLNNILVRVTSPDCNSELVSLFINSYWLYSTPDILWHKLKDRYFSPKSIDDKQRTVIKLHTATFLAQWLKRDVHLIDSSIISEIANFARTELTQDGFESLSNVIIKEINTVDDRFMAVERSTCPPSMPIFLILEKNYNSFVLHFNDIDIAEQLTLIEWKIYQKIEPRELLEQGWVKESRSILSCNVISMMKRANEISYWVATTILLQEDISARAMIMEKFISLAKHLVDLENFNTLMGILAGLNLFCISRLTNTVNMISKKWHEEWKSLQEYQNPRTGFRSLRQASAKGIVSLPYLGLYLADLIKIDEGNQTLINEDDKDLINLPKFSMLSACAHNCLYYKEANRDISIMEPLHSLVSNLPTLSDDELFQMSLDIQPN